MQIKARDICAVLPAMMPNIHNIALAAPIDLHHIDEGGSITSIIYRGVGACTRLGALREQQKKP